MRHLFKLGDTRLRIDLPFKLADIDVLDTVLIQKVYCPGHVARRVEIDHIVLAGYHIVGVVKPLLCLMPVPTDNSRKPSVDRHPLRPGVQVPSRFNDGRTARNVVAQPLDSLLVVSQLNLNAILTILGIIHVRLSIDPHANLLEPFRRLLPSRHHRVDQYANH